MKFETRPYQQEAWDALDAARAAGKKRALLCLATGLGKTFVAANDALRFKRRHDGMTACRILFVSHMRDISAQAKATFERIDPGLKTGMFHPGLRMYLGADTVFATFQALYVSLDKYPRDYFDYIIWDEAHHIEAETFKKVCVHFQPKFELGLTATPQRRDSKDIQGYFGEAVYTKKLADGIAEGWLAEVDYRLVLDDGLKEIVKQGFTPKSIQDIKQLFKHKPRNEVIAKNVYAERHKIGMDLAKTIVFCGTIRHAVEMAELLGGRAYHSEMTAEQRAMALKDFKAGRIHTLCTRDMFNEGVDIPDARLIVFLRSTSSSTIFEQQLGRGLRKAPGKTSVVVLDFAANLRRLVFARKLGQDISYAIRNKTGQFVSVVRPLDDSPKVPQQLDLGGIKFEFDQLAADLLEIYDETEVPVAKGRYYTLPEAAKKLHISRGLLNKYIEYLGIDIKLLRNPSLRSRSMRMISSQQVRVIRDHILGQDIRIADDTIISLFKLSRELRTSIRALRKVIVLLGIPISVYRFAQRRAGEGVERKYVAQIKDAYAAPGLTYAEVADKFGVHPKGVSLLIKRVGLKTIRHPATGKRLITHGQLRAIQRYRDQRRQPIPIEDILSVYKRTKSIQRVADKYGVSWNAIQKRLAKAGVDHRKDRK